MRSAARSTPVPPHLESTATELQQALEPVLQSAVFRRAQRSQRFLRYLVEAAAANPPLPVKEYTIAIDVFDRDSTYDPAVDATVRVEASRLRARLREYYAEEGRGDPWILEVPKGGYAAVLRWRGGTQARPVLVAPAKAPGVPGEPFPAPVPADPVEAIAGEASERGKSRAGGRRSLGSLFWLGVATVVLAALVAGGRALRLRQGTASTRPAAAGLPEATSLAILPLRNESGNAGLDLPADGLTDDLIRQLAQIPALRLLSRTMAFHYAQPGADPHSVGRALGVDAVLVSGLRRTPEHLVVSAELSRASDGFLLLDREYIVDGKDLHSVQAALQGDIVKALHVEGSARDPGRKLASVTLNPEAYREFSEGNALARGGTRADLHRAIEHFERAVALDPRFDLAWSGLASEHLLLGLYFEAPRDHMPLARRFAQRALAINPALGEAHGSLGLIHLVYDWDLPASEAEMSTAGAEQSSVGVLACTVHLMERAGQPRTAEELLGRMLSYDPHAVVLLSELGCVDYYRGDYVAALRHYKEAQAADPHSPLPFWGLGKTLNAQGRHTEAVDALEGFKRLNGFEPPILTAERGYAWGAAGDRQRAGQAMHALAEAGRAGFVDPYLTALICASMKDRNDRDATFAWLERARVVRSSFLISILSDPKWAPFRADPRFAALVGRMQQGRVG